MKRRVGKNRKATKGMPSAVLLSIAIHAALFFLAGMLVVFTVVKKKEIEFEPPKAVERPKMKLKKPKPKIKKSARPKQAKHILAKVNPVNMPEIQLPEISGGGLGGGLGEGIGGGFDTMPDLDKVTVFGGGQSIGNDFEGTFYDVKRDRRGRTLSVDTFGDEWRNLIHKFLKQGWKTSVFSRYYRSPQKLYATNFVVPLQPSSVAPVSFGDKDAVGALWMVHYKGQLVHEERIKFRFWGMADEFMAVRVDGEMVLGYEWSDTHNFATVTGDLWQSKSADSRRYYMGDRTAVVGDWITLEPGVPLDMEIIMGDNGRVLCYFLAVEVEGVEYERNRQGGPILPAFKTAEPLRDQLDLIYKFLPEGEICLTNGPVFNDYSRTGRTAALREDDAVEATPIAQPLPLVLPGKNETRTWTLSDGRAVEAEFVNVFGGKVVLKSAKGEIYKVQPEQLSAADLDYVELAEPPDLDINILKSFDQKRFYGGWYDTAWWGRPPEHRGHFGCQIKQTSAGEYNRELQVEIFMVGSQRSGDTYILLDHQQTVFNPAREDRRFFEFRSPREVVLHRYTPDMLYGTTQSRGEKYAGYLVTVTDERGEVIVVKTSKKWLLENLENLKKLSVGNYMDKTCTRTFPSRPTSRMY